MNKAECEERAKELASKILRANADPLEVQYAVGQLMPLYEMISEDDDIFIAPGSIDFTFGSLLDVMMARMFQTVDGRAGPEGRFYVECFCCHGTDAERPLGARPSRTRVKHLEDGCLLAKHLPRLRAMANKDAT